MEEPCPTKGEKQPRHMGCGAFYMLLSQHRGPHETLIYIVAILLSHAVAVPTPPQLISPKQFDLVYQDLSWSLHRSEEVVTPSCKAPRTLDLSQKNGDLCASPGRQEFVRTLCSCTISPEASAPMGDLVGMNISAAVLMGLKELGAVQLLLSVPVPADPFARSKSWHSQPLCPAASQHGIRQPLSSAPCAQKKVCAGFLICKPPSWPP